MLLAARIFQTANPEITLGKPSTSVCQHFGTLIDSQEEGGRMFLGHSDSCLASAGPKIENSARPDPDSGLCRAILQLFIRRDL